MKNKFIIILLLLMIFTLSGCDKKSITGESFSAKLTNSECTVTNLSENYESNYNIVEMYKAYCENFDIEYYKFDSSSTAKDIFNTNYDTFIKDKTGTNLEKKYDEGNYNIYSLTCGGKFRYISRIDDTLIYVYDDDTYKKDIIKILDILGY